MAPNDDISKRIEVSPPPIWPEPAKVRLIAYVEKWRGLLMLGGHHVNVKFSDEPWPHEDEPSDPTCSATCSVNDDYRSGHCVTFYPRMLREPDADEQERKVAHELLHIITEPSKELARLLLNEKLVTWREVKAANETLTDWLANVVVALAGEKTRDEG